MDRGPWRATVHGVAKSRTRLSDFHSDFIITPWGLCPFNDMAITHDHILLSFGIKMFQPARFNLCLGSDK